MDRARLKGSDHAAENAWRARAASEVSPLLLIPVLLPDLVNGTFFLLQILLRWFYSEQWSSTLVIGVNVWSKCNESIEFPSLSSLCSSPLNLQFVSLPLLFLLLLCNNSEFIADFVDSSTSSLGFDMFTLRLTDDSACTCPVLSTFLIPQFFGLSFHSRTHRTLLNSFSYSAVLCMSLPVT